MSVSLMKKAVFFISIILLFSLISPIVFAQTQQMQRLFPWRNLGYKPSFECPIRFEINSPDTVMIQAGKSASTNVTISDVRCGLTHAMLLINGIPEEWYNISPEFHSSIVYSDGPKNFTINFNIPEDIEPGTYTSTLSLKSSVLDFIDIENLTVIVLNRSISSIETG